MAWISLCKIRSAKYNIYKKIGLQAENRKFYFTYFFGPEAMCTFSVLLSIKGVGERFSSPACLSHAIPHAFLALRSPVGMTGDAGYLHRPLPRYTDVIPSESCHLQRLPYAKQRMKEAAGPRPGDPAPWTHRSHFPSRCSGTPPPTTCACLPRLSSYPGPFRKVRVIFPMGLGFSNKRGKTDWLHFHPSQNPRRRNL